MGNSHPLSYVTGSEVNGSRPVGSGELGFEKPLGLCPGFRLEAPTYSIHTFFYFYLYIFLYLGLDGNPLFLRCPINLLFRNPQGLLNLSKSGSEPRHTL